MKIKLNRREIQRFLKSQRVQDMLQNAGDTVAQRAGDGFTASVNVGTRARATVLPETLEAKKQQARDHVLERAVGGGI